MAFTCGFFNSDKGDRKYNAEQISAIFDGIIADGVFATIGDHMMVTAGTGMQVRVGTGKAWFDHTWNVNDSLYLLDIATSDVSLDRIDAIVLETNHSDSVRFNGFKVIRGAVSSTPVKPTLTNTETIHQHPLAWVRVKAGATTITSSMIENAVGKSECPFVTGVVEVTNIDDIFNQWQGEFDEWFANLKTQLSGDVAANLQRQIDENREAINNIETFYTKEIQYPDYWHAAKLSSALLSIPNVTLSSSLDFIYSMNREYAGIPSKFSMNPSVFEDGKADFYIWDIKNDTIHVCDLKPAIQQFFNAKHPSTDFTKYVYTQLSYGQTPIVGDNWWIIKSVFNYRKNSDDRVTSEEFFLRVDYDGTVTYLLNNNLNSDYGYRYLSASDGFYRWYPGQPIKFYDKDYLNETVLTLPSEITSTQDIKFYGINNLIKIGKSSAAYYYYSFNKGKDWFRVSNAGNDEYLDYSNGYYYIRSNTTGSTSFLRNPGSRDSLWEEVSPTPKNAEYIRSSYGDDLYMGSSGNNMYRIYRLRGTSWELVHECPINKAVTIDLPESICNEKPIYPKFKELLSPRRYSISLDRAMFVCRLVGDNIINKRFQKGSVHHLYNTTYKTSGWIPILFFGIPLRVTTSSGEIFTIERETKPIGFYPNEKCWDVPETVYVASPNNPSGYPRVGSARFGSVVDNSGGDVRYTGSSIVAQGNAIWIGGKSFDIEYILPFEEEENI